MIFNYANLHNLLFNLFKIYFQQIFSIQYDYYITPFTE